MVGGRVGGELQSRRPLLPVVNTTSFWMEKRALTLIGIGCRRSLDTHDTDFFIGVTAHKGACVCAVWRQTGNLTPPLHGTRSFWSLVYSGDRCRRPEGSIDTDVEWLHILIAPTSIFTTAGSSRIIRGSKITCSELDGRTINLCNPDQPVIQSDPLKVIFRHRNTPGRFRNGSRMLVFPHYGDLCTRQSSPKRLSTTNLICLPSSFFGAC